MEREPRIEHPTAGFTMVELLLAVLLGAMIMLSFAAIYANSYKWFRTSVQGNMRQAGMIASVQAIQRDVEKATYVAHPLPPCDNGCCGSAPAVCPTQTCNGGPCFGDTLDGSVNSDPLSTNGDTRLYEAMPSRIFRFCVDGSQKLWYTWRDYAPGTPPAFPPPATSCGTAFPGGQVQLLASSIARSPFRSADCSPDAASSYFCRPAYANNVVEMNFIVSGTTVSARVGTAMPVTAPAP